MTRAVRLAIVVVLGLGIDLGLRAPALAQDPPSDAIIESPIDAPDPAPRSDSGPLSDLGSTPKAEETDAQRLDRLFAELAVVGTEAEADFIAEEIEAIWSGGESPTAELLVDRSMIALETGDAALARRLVDAALKTSPKSVMAWSQSAHLAFEAGDTTKSVEDLQAALELDPRHYPSWLGLGAVLESIERWDGAYEAYTRALALHPHLAEAEAGRAELERRVRGRDL